MKPLRTLPALVVAAVLVLSACTSSGSNSTTYHYTSAQSVPDLIKISARKPADDFSGSLLNGGTYKLSKDAAGKVTVVNFWGAWCGPCKVETPQFGLVYDAFKNKQVTFVGIDVKEASRSLPRSFVKLNNIHYPILYDGDGEVAVRLGNVPTQVVPFTILLDKHHRVAAVYIQRLAPTDLEPVLTKLAAEK